MDKSKRTILVTGATGKQEFESDAAFDRVRNKVFEAEAVGQGEKRRQ